MKRRKIIHIYNRSYDAYFPTEESEYYYLAGWSSAVARETMKYTDSYVIENWRPERDVTKVTVREVQGIVCRLFPSLYSKHFGDLSIKMLRELKIHTDKYETLIHHSGIHCNSLRSLALLFKDTPIVAQHHGDLPPFVKFKQNGKPKLYLSHSAEKMLLSNIDHFFVLRKAEMEFLSLYAPNADVSLQTMGVDFDKFKPIDKATSRKVLHFPPKKKIILYVGHFYNLKGVALILETYKALQRKHDIELVLVGGSQSDELYDEVVSTGARYYGMIPHDDLPLYYSAADVYLLPAFSSCYWGIDVTTIESLACGTPIVSTTLRDFPTHEWRHLGVIPENENDVPRCVSSVLDNAHAYHNCRKVSQKYYDWRNIIRHTVMVYENLFEEYYG